MDAVEAPQVHRPRSRTQGLFAALKGAEQDRREFLTSGG
jgi:hypothetical protein